ncbi:MAG: AsmA-like C-terminal domain-containing protein [Planctomycetota bacterium]
MGGRLQALRRVLRQQRSWRYISARRRSTGLIVLALIAASVYGYWYFTNSARVRDMAEDYLEAMTGARVDVRDAEFRLFGRVVLEDVTLRLPGADAPRPMLHARRVVLSHRPWALLTAARFEPTRVVCTDTDLRVRYEDGVSNVERLRDLSRRRRPPGEGAPGRLPPIELRNVKLFTPGDEDRPQMAFDMSLLAREQGLYELVMSETGRQSLVTLVIDVGRGEPVEARVEMDLSDLGEFVPELRGLIGRHVTDARGPCELLWTRKGEKGMLLFKGARLRLAGPLGGVAADEVTGALHFEHSGESRNVRFEDVQGRLLAERASTRPAATQPRHAMGRFALTAGEYRGETGGRFTATVALEDVDLSRLPATGSVGAAVAPLREQFRPRGRCDAEVEIAASPDAPARVSGRAELRDVTVRARAFPHPVSDLHGTVTFDREQVALDLTGTPAGGGTVRCEGTVVPDPTRPSYDLTLHAADVALDADVGEAMRAAGLGGVWRDIRPSGAGTLELHLWHSGGDAPETVELRVHPSDRGPLRVLHRFFPYPVSVVGGRVIIRGDDVHIPAPYERRPGGPGPIHGVAGPAEFFLYGRIDNVDTDRFKVDLTVEADNVPLDETLNEALAPSARKAVRSLHASGRLGDVQARLRQTAGEPVDYDVIADFRRVRLRCDAFPYALSDAEGQVRITPDGLDIRALRGVHANPQGPVTRARLSGQVSFGPAGEVRLAGRLDGAALGPALRDALPAEVRELWRRFEPAGRADVEVRRYVSARDRRPDFDVRLVPRDATFRYPHLPYRLQLGGAGETAGIIAATPGKVVLGDLSSTRAVDGARVGLLSGTVRYEPEQVTAELRLVATGLPVSAERFAALPAPVSEAVGRLRPSGRFDIRLEPARLVWRTRDAPASRPTTAPATRTAPRELAEWDFSGQIVLPELSVRTTAGTATVTGTVAGRATKTADGVALTAEATGVDVALDGDPRAQDVTAKVVKPARLKRVFIKEMFGRTYGGAVDGRGFVALERPVRYHLLVTFDEMDLAEVLPADGPRVAGRLQGRMEITAAVGRTRDRRASGQLRISKARISKLPVLLSALQIIYLSVPGSSSVTDGFIEYHLTDQMLVFREIHLGGAAVSIVGSGTLDLATRKVNLTFLRTESAALPRIDSIRELLEGIVREIVEVRVTGTLAEPEVRTVTTPSIRDAVRTILNPRRKSE